MKSYWDTIIIGAGPKGLAMKLKLEKNGVNACILEKHSQAGNSWSPEFMDPLMPITNDIEVTEEKEFTFKNWYKNLSGAELSKYSSKFGLMTAKHYFDYIQMFAKRLSDIYYNTSVTKIDIKPSGLIKIKCDNNLFSCKHLIISSGMTGYGEQEFSRNNLYKKGAGSELVAYTPDTIRTEKDFISFVGDSKHLALVGSGMSQVATILALPLFKGVQKISFFSARSFHDDSSKLSLEYNHKYSDLVRQRYLDQRIVKYPFSNIKKVDYADGKVMLSVERGGIFESFKVDKVIFATGYSYKFTELPFLSSLLPDLEVEQVGDEFFPRIDSHNRAVLKGNPSEVYFLGAATAKHNSKKRQLDTTAEEVNSISEGIIGRKLEDIFTIQRQIKNLINEV